MNEYVRLNIKTTKKQQKEVRVCPLVFDTQHYYCAAGKKQQIALIKYLLFSAALGTHKNLFFLQYIYIFAFMNKLSFQWQ